MRHRSARTAILEALGNIMQAWCSGDWRLAEESIHEGTLLRSSAHGDARGSAAIASLLSADIRNGVTLTLHSANHYVGGHDRCAAMSAYLFGHLDRLTSDHRARVTFGATLVGSLREISGVWRFDDLRLSVNWLDGDRSLASNWAIPDGDRGWKVGDPSPTIVSETDSPWVLLPRPTIVGTPYEQIAEVYSRYAWALDQADFTLLTTCFTNDAAGDFQPIGRLDGRHEIIGTLKEFRRPWPWMQHFGKPLQIDINEGGDLATMIVGRIIPQQTRTADGHELYGAHYRMKLRHEDTLWKLVWSEYRPGWMTALASQP